jgi:hypothetical protein
MDGEGACRASSILLLQQCLQGAAYSHAIACCGCSESGQEPEAYWSVELWQLLLYASLARLCCLPELLKLCQHITLCRYSITSIGYCCSMGSAASAALLVYSAYIPMSSGGRCCMSPAACSNNDRTAAVMVLSSAGNPPFNVIYTSMQSYLLFCLYHKERWRTETKTTTVSKTPKMCDPGLTYTKHKANELRDRRQVQCIRCGTCKGFDRFEHSCHLSQTGMASQAPGSATRAHGNALGRLHRSSHRYWRNAWYHQLAAEMQLSARRLQPQLRDALQHCHGRAVVPTPPSRTPWSVRCAEYYTLYNAAVHCSTQLTTGSAPCRDCATASPSPAPQQSDVMHCSGTVLHALRCRDSTQVAADAAAAPLLPTDCSYSQSLSAPPACANCCSRLQVREQQHRTHKAAAHTNSLSRCTAHVSKQTSTAAADASG